LTGTDHTNQTDEAYSYDANGNRTSGGSVTGVNNQLLNDGTYSYTYDGEGNRTKRVEIATGKVTEYNWDYRNRLTAVLFKDASGNVTKTIDYIYDGNNQRIGKRIDGAVVERYVIDRNQIALVFDGAGVQTHRYLYGTQIDQVLADETATSMVWALADNQGTVKDLVDNSGVVVNHITYDSFGKVVAQNNASVEFRYGYTGREQDGETGLDYYRARYYDANNGRFISEDPIGFNAGDANLYRYVGNSPINGTDPSGYRGVDLSTIQKTGETIQKAAPFLAPFLPFFQPLIPLIVIPGGVIIFPPELSNGELPLKRPVARPTQTPTPSPSPLPEVITPPKPNFCVPEDKNKTCANHEEFHKYAHISEATSNPRVAFDGFIYEDLPTTIIKMKSFRNQHVDILDDRSLFSETVVEKGKTIPFGGGIQSTNDLFPDPDSEARHYNIYIQGTNNQSGGSAGKYKFCDDTGGKTPNLVTRFGIFNIKDNSGSDDNKYYNMRTKRRRR
jgi:RHS repeat-associated protein